MRDAIDEAMNLAGDIQVKLLEHFVRAGLIDDMFDPPEWEWPPDDPLPPLAELRSYPTKRLVLMFSNVASRYQAILHGGVLPTKG